MNLDELEFAIFCIEGIAERLGINGGEAYKLLSDDSDILDEYIIKYYDPLHTQGKEYIVNDILELMQREGVVK
jgi:hypothetical protein